MRFVYYDPAGEEHIEDFPYFGFKGATNNEMELEACIKGLEQALKLHDLDRMTEVLIFTDSRYVKDHWRTAMYTWPGNGWKTREGDPVANRKLWKKLIHHIVQVRRLRKNFDIKWEKGKTHVHNKAVDQHAKKSAQTVGIDLISIKEIRRKRSPSTVDPGSVKMRGQRFTIHIRECQYESFHKLFKLKFEVITKKSVDCGKVDFIFYEHLLKTGHAYMVTVSDDETNRRIIKVHREYKKGNGNCQQSDEGKESAQ